MIGRSGAGRAYAPYDAGSRAAGTWSARKRPALARKAPSLPLAPTVAALAAATLSLVWRRALVWRRLEALLEARLDHNQSV